MATYNSTVAVTFILSLVTIGYMVLKQPQNLSTTKQFDVKDVKAVRGVSPNLSTTKQFDVKDVKAVRGVSPELDLVKEWNVACKSRSMSPGQFTLSRVHIGPVTFLGPCYNDKKMVVNVVGNVVANLKNVWPNNIDAWIKFDHVNNLQITGTGIFDGNGLDWWKSYGGKQRSCESNPTALSFNECHRLFLQGVTSKNSPRNHISINGCNGATISNINIMASPTSPNTDGIDIANTNGVNIIGGHIGTGDDCIAINGNISNINITSLSCGPGHGISVGSLGRNSAKDVVSNIRVVGVTFTNTQNGVRIKTVPGGSGSASQITFSGITMTNVEHPIILTQFYCPHVDPQNCPNKAQMVQISGVSFYDIHGTSSTPDAINIHCSPNPNSCNDIALEKINIQPANPSAFKVGSTCVDTSVAIKGSVFPPVNCIRAPSMIKMPLDYDYNESQPAVATS